MRILVTGAAGLLGSKVVAAAAHHEVFAACNSSEPDAACEKIKMDVRNPGAVNDAFEKTRPDVVVHAAALTDVDYCETHPSEARDVNALGTKHVSEACAAAGAKMIYVSTDYVFDGKKGDYIETDAPNPLSHYAKTKFEGEGYAQQLGEWAIARTSVVYGAHRAQNFATWVIKKLGNNERIRVVTDQYSCPTLADNCAEGILAIIDKRADGIFHVAGSECLSRLGFAKRIADVFELDAALIEPVTSAELKQPAPRPLKNCLGTSKARALGVRLLDATEGLERMKIQIRRSV